LNVRPLTADLTRITLSILAIGALTVGSIWVLAPFIFALIWATMIVIATWPILKWLERRFGGRRAPAVAVMVVALLGLLVIPVWLLVDTIAEHADRVVTFARSIATHGLPPPPPWVQPLPLVGERLAAAWRSVAGDPASLAARLAPHFGEGVRWVASRAGSVAGAVVQFLLIVLISGILYALGESGALGVRRFLRRLAGERGENVAHLAAKAVRAVALGIVVTAVTQTVVAGIGLFLAEVPYAGALTAVTFVLCIIQLGPLLVLAPAVIWLYATGAAVRGTVLLVIGIVAIVLDNLLRPILIKRGADLPLLLIIAGVVGGLIAVGVVGLFVGPVVLAVTWTLIGAWVGELDQPAGQAGSGV
jgi:predicted PurR-regulated permease PerM